jgi:DNA-binding transcriptional MerR regulator
MANGRKGRCDHANIGFLMSKKSYGAAVQTAVADACGNDHAQGHLLTINAVAKMFRVSTWTLRFYELRGLIHRHSMGGEAVFSWRDCECIALIIKAKKAGLTVRRIAPVIEAMGANASQESLKAGHQRCRDLIAGIIEYSDAVADVLAELERIDWEFSTRLAEKIARR